MPCNRAHTATEISGVSVITDMIANPKEASLRPVISIKSSTALIVKWLNHARTTKETASIPPCIKDSIVRHQLNCYQTHVLSSRLRIIVFPELREMEKGR